MGFPDDTAIARRSKRSKSSRDDGPPKELVSFARPASEEDSNNNNRTMPDTVYSLIWSFLLEPGQAHQSAREYTCTLDLQSISSFLLVNQRAKEEFHALEGWRLVAKALSRESIQRHGQTKRMLTILADIAEKARAILARRSGNHDDDD